MPEQSQQAKPRIDVRAMQGYLDVLEAPKVERRRQTLIISVLAVAVAALSIIIAMMMPLRQMVPFFIEVETATGRVEVTDRVAQRFEATEPAIRYFLGRWIVDSYTIDESTRPRIEGALRFLRGPAIEQFRRLIVIGERPFELLTNNPLHRRAVEFVAPPQIVAPGSAVVRIALVEGRNVVGRRQVNIRFAILPPQTDDDILRNPIGLWITDISVVNETF